MEQGRSYLLGSRRHSNAIEKRKMLIENRNQCEKYNQHSEWVKQEFKNVEKVISENKHRLEDLHAVEVNMRNHNAVIAEMLDDIQEFKNVEEVIFENKHRLEDLHAVEANLRNNNAVITEMLSDIQDLKEKLTENTYAYIDYFEFENHFRGSREHIKQCQSQYVKYFENCNSVLDLGSGRGEFLELMKEQGISAIGVDLYEPFISLCREYGLQVEQADALEYLKQCESTDGIFASQLIEHLSIGKVIELCETAYQKMTPGAYMILETPNPMSLAVFTNSFYIDPSHVKPVHPLTLKYLAEKIGFQSVELLFTESSRMPVSIPQLKIADMRDAEAFNESMQRVSEMLFGSQDYALIARK